MSSLTRVLPINVCLFVCFALASAATISTVRRSRHITMSSVVPAAKHDCALLELLQPPKGRLEVAQQVRNDEILTRIVKGALHNVASIVLLFLLSIIKCIPFLATLRSYRGQR